MKLRPRSSVLGPPSSSSGLPPPSRRRRLALWLCAFAILCLLLILFRSPLLRGTANAWVISDHLEEADAIVVLGGGLDTRPFEAARLFQLKLAPRILLMNPKPSLTTQLGIIESEAELGRRILLHEQVPENCVEILTNQVTNTHDESLALGQWLQTHNAHRVIITTDLFHTRRARWLFRKQLKPTGVQVLVDAAPMHDFTTADWWRHENAIVAFQNEILKYAYYRLKY